MSDPFVSRNSSQQTIRETKLGIGIALLLFGIVGIWSYFQYGKISNDIPLHIQNAPIAQHVGPEYYLRNLNESSQANANESKHVRSNTNQQRESFVSTQITGAEVVSVRNNKHDSPANRKSDLRLANPTNNQAPKPEMELAYNRPDRIRNPNKSTPASDISKSLATTESKSTSGNLFDSRVPESTQFQPNQHRIANNKTSTIDEHPIASPIIVPDNLVRQSNFEQTEFAAVDEKKAEELNTSNDFSVNRDDAIRDTVQQRAPGTARLPNADEKASEFLPIQPHQPIEDESLDNLTVEVIDPFQPDLSIGAGSHESSFSAGSIEKNQYQVVDGDSFWSIAQTLYNDGRYFRALFEHNRARVDQFDDIPVGHLIETPQIEILEMTYPDLCPHDSESESAGRHTVQSAENSAQKYRTQPGDTLFDIARQTTGQASRYLDIIELNKKKLPQNITHLTRLPANLELQLPN